MMAAALTCAAGATGSDVVVSVDAVPVDESFFPALERGRDDDGPLR
jgi:hypothetical protein